MRLVLVVGCRQQVNELLEEQGVHAQHACGYRVTDAVAMQAVVQAAGSSRMEVEARLSKVRSGVPQVCRGHAGSHAIGGVGSWQQLHGGRSPHQQRGSKVQYKWLRLGLSMGPPSPSTCLKQTALPARFLTKHRRGILQAQLLKQVLGLLDEWVAACSSLQSSWCGATRLGQPLVSGAAAAAGSLPDEGGVPALQGPAIQMVRRHSRSTDAFHFGPALQTVSGNWVAGKRRGVIDGIDFGLTGTVSGAPGFSCRTCSKSGTQASWVHFILSGMPPRQYVL